MKGIIAMKDDDQRFASRLSLRKRLFARRRWRDRSRPVDEHQYRGRHDSRQERSDQNAETHLYHDGFVNEGERSDEQAE
jgi:hypothetical protein